MGVWGTLPHGLTTLSAYSHSVWHFRYLTLSVFWTSSILQTQCLHSLVSCAHIVLHLDKGCALQLILDSSNPDQVPYLDKFKEKKKKNI